MAVDTNLYEEMLARSGLWFQQHWEGGGSNIKIFLGDYTPIPLAKYSIMISYLLWTSTELTDSPPPPPVYQALNISVRLGII